MSCTGPSFSQALSHALKMLGTPGLLLKEEQKQAIHAVYDANDVIVWLPQESKGPYHVREGRV